MSDGLRPPTEDDLDFIVGLMSEHAPEPMEPEFVRRDWTSPVVDVEQDVRIEADAYCLVEDLTEGRAWVDIHGRPSTALLDWGESLAAEKGARLFSGVWASNEALAATLAERGFGVVRHSHRMEIDFGQPVPSADWPEGIAVRPFQPGDEHTFHDVHQETFEDTWEPIRETYEEWAHWLMQPPEFAPELWFLAIAGDEPAGLAICHRHTTRPELGWVRILGVRRPWRRLGVARAILLHAFGQFAARGMRGAGLGVDATSTTGANKLYEQAGMRVVARFDIYEKVVA